MECLNENQDKVNDYYILKEDKLNLIRVIKNIYKNSMPWADDVLMRVLVKEHYKNVIKNMDEEEYKKELKNNDLNYLVENI
tara:strand:- start:1301 stop:1543 length:243 start_codon:yes stop_codon:yes gene_type:complete